MKTILERLLGINDLELMMTKGDRLDLPGWIQESKSTYPCKNKLCQNRGYCLRGKLYDDIEKVEKHVTCGSWIRSTSETKDCGGIKHDFPENLNLWEIDNWTDTEYDEQIDNLIWLYEINR